MNKPQDKHWNLPKWIWCQHVTPSVGTASLHNPWQHTHHVCVWLDTLMAKTQISIAVDNNRGLSSTNQALSNVMRPHGQKLIMCSCLERYIAVLSPWWQSPDTFYGQMILTEHIIVWLLNYFNDSHTSNTKKYVL